MSLLEFIMKLAGVANDIDDMCSMLTVSIQCGDPLEKRKLAILMLQKKAGEVALVLQELQNTEIGAELPQE